eukprot:103217-Pyramimonas_sp.AAC.1
MKRRNGWRETLSRPLGPPVELLMAYGATKRRTGWRGTHVVTAPGAFGGAPYGATKRRTGWRGTHV